MRDSSFFTNIKTLGQTRQYNPEFFILRQQLSVQNRTDAKEKRKKKKENKITLRPTNLFLVRPFVPIDRPFYCPKDHLHTRLSS